jgi:hypothetical protein
MAEIDGYTEIIEKDTVESRIEELNDSRLWQVVRLRTGDIIRDEFDSEDQADRYVDEEDFNRERVSVRQAELDEDDSEELTNLARLVEDVGVDDSWTLYNESYFSEDWAKQEAVEELGVYRSAVDEWPLSQIDWEEARDERRDGRYDYQYGFDGTTFYGSE